MTALLKAVCTNVALYKRIVFCFIVGGKEFRLFPIFGCGKFATWKSRKSGVKYTIVATSSSGSEVQTIQFFVNQIIIIIIIFNPSVDMFPRELKELI